MYNVNLCSPLYYLILAFESTGKNPLEKIKRRNLSCVVSDIQKFITESNEFVLLLSIAIQYGHCTTSITGTDRSSQRLCSARHSVLLCWVIKQLPPKCVQHGMQRDSAAVLAEKALVRAQFSVTEVVARRQKSDGSLGLSHSLCFAVSPSEAWTVEALHLKKTKSVSGIQEFFHIKDQECADALFFHF